MRNISLETKETLSLKQFFELYHKELELTILTELDTLDTHITQKNRFPNRPGLAFTGFTKGYNFERIQIIGTAEWSYLNGINSSQFETLFQELASYLVPCFILARNFEIPDDFLNFCRIQKIPLLRSKLKTSFLIYKLQKILDAWFEPFCNLHGTLVDVYGVGILYIGKSGIGKSECALDLVERGHRLVADDSVKIFRKGQAIIATAANNLGYYMEIRGVGIVDVFSLFGVRAIRKVKKIEVIVELEVWSKDAEYDRIGLDEKFETIMGIEVPKKVIPISPGKNITVISEVIAMDILLKNHGIHMARQFNTKLQDKIKNKSQSNRLENADDFFE